MKDKVDITIIGAGLTGLAAAHFLMKAGKSVRIIEKANRAGGVINSISKDGFTFETGPNTGVSSNKEVEELIRDMSDHCQVEYARPESKKRLIWKKGKWHALPSGPVSGIATSLFSAYDKIKILFEPWRKRGTDPFESVASMVKRRLGKSYLHYAVDPFVSGVYAGDPEYLVTKYALPKLYRLEQDYGSFMRGAIKKAKERKASGEPKHHGKIFNFDGGMVSLIHALEESIGEDKIFLGCSHTEITPLEKHYTISLKQGEKPLKWQSCKVIICSGSHDIEKLLPFVEESNLHGIKRLEHAKIIQVAVGFKEWKGMPLDSYGGLIPSKEHKDLLGILFPSSVFFNRAPKGGALLSFFIGGFRHPEMLNLSDSEIEALVLTETTNMLRLKDPKPDLISIHRYHAAIPQYGRSSEERYKNIADIEARYPGLILAGNMRDGIGMADRIKQAKILAEGLD